MKSEILKFVAIELVGETTNANVQSSDDLLTTELVDSIGVMRLIAFVETFKLKIPIEDVTIENFISVDAICDYLESRENKREGSANA